MRDGNKTLGYGVVTALLDDVDLDAIEAENKAAKKAAKKAKEAQAYSWTVTNYQWVYYNSRSFIHLR